MSFHNLPLLPPSEADSAFRPFIEEYLGWPQEGSAPPVERQRKLGGKLVILEFEPLCDAHAWHRWVHVRKADQTGEILVASWDGRKQTMREWSADERAAADSLTPQSLSLHLALDRYLGGRSAFDEDFQRKLLPYSPTANLRFQPNGLQFTEVNQPLEQLQVEYHTLGRIAALV